MRLRMKLTKVKFACGVRNWEGHLPICLTVQWLRCQFQSGAGEMWLRPRMELAGAQYICHRTQCP